MTRLFYKSQFNGDISKWDVSHVENMNKMFYRSHFNGDILEWNVSNVQYMNGIFADSNFNGDLSDWKPYKLREFDLAFSSQNIVKPYWARISDFQTRVKAINSYELSKKLEVELSVDSPPQKRMKI